LRPQTIGRRGRVLVATRERRTRSNDLAEESERPDIDLLLR